MIVTQLPLPLHPLAVTDNLLPSSELGMSTSVSKATQRWPRFSEMYDTIVSREGRELVSASSGKPFPGNCSFDVTCDYLQSVGKRKDILCDDENLRNVDSAIWINSSSFLIIVLHCIEQVQTKTSCC